MPDIKALIAECTAYDFKEMLERKKVKSWLKSVSAFSNAEGGSLYYGVNDKGEIVGLDNPQSDADFISETIKSRIDPIPDFEIIPFEYDGKHLLEVKVCSALRGMAVFSSASTRAIPRISRPRFIAEAHPDQKYPMPGVFFPDLEI